MSEEFEIHWQMFNPYIAENRWVSIVIEFSVVRIVEIEDFPIWISFHIIHAFYCSPINLLTFTLNWTLIKFSTRLATYKKKRHTFVVDQNHYINIKCSIDA